MKALKNGQPIVAQVHSDGPFTDKGHYIILTGINEEGKIMVNDPNGFNYNILDYESGFDESVFSEHSGCFLICGKKENDVVEQEKIELKDDCEENERINTNQFITENIEIIDIEDIENNRERIRNVKYDSIILDIIKAEEDIQNIEFEQPESTKESIEESESKNSESTKGKIFPKFNSNREENPKTESIPNVVLGVYEKINQYKDYSFDVICEKFEGLGWKKITNKEEIEAGDIICIDDGEMEIALIYAGDNKWYTIKDTQKVLENIIIDENKKWFAYRPS